MRSEEHTSELQSHVRISYAVFCLKKKKQQQKKKKKKKTKTQKKKKKNTQKRLKLTKNDENFLHKDFMGE